MSDATEAVARLEEAARRYELAEDFAKTMIEVHLACGDNTSARFSADEAVVAHTFADRYRAQAKIIAKVPYPKFCMHPERCVGLSHCERDPVCCD